MCDLVQRSAGPYPWFATEYLICYEKFMSIIIVKTERSFAAKDKELHELFKKSHAPHLKRLSKLENAVKKLQKQALSSQKMGKANLAKKMREIRKLDEMASVEREKGGRPRRYPDGALLPEVTGVQQTAFFPKSESPRIISSFS